MTDDGFTFSKMLDGIVRRRHGGSDGEQGPSADEQRATAEAASFKAAEQEGARRRQVRRMVAARYALVDGIGTLKHGTVYDSEDRAELVAGIVKRLGGEVTPEVRAHVVKLVNEAADAIADGDAMTGQRGVEATAHAIADAPGKIAELGVQQQHDDDDTDDPDELARRIPRG